MDESLKGETFMSQLVKGGKWVFGWVVVFPGGEVPIPPAAFIEYGFQPGERVLFLRGSGLALGFVQCGPIYEATLKHAEVETFSI
jgi:hypothetical protein